MIKQVTALVFDWNNCENHMLSIRIGDICAEIWIQDLSLRCIGRIYSTTAGEKSSVCAGHCLRRLQISELRHLIPFEGKLPQNKLWKFVPGDVHSATNETCWLLVFGVNISLIYPAVLLGWAAAHVSASWSSATVICWWYWEHFFDLRQTNCTETRK
jgi:hypothetical protein